MRSETTSKLHVLQNRVNKTKTTPKGGKVVKAMRYKLKEVRKERGLTQEEVAEKIGICMRYYQKIEAGESTGAVWVWDALEELLRVNQQQLRALLDIHLSPASSRLGHQVDRRFL
jgi:DNA-binding XRE family transcriptional regulator